MSHRNALFALFTAILALSGIRASAQAHVTENQTHYLYVDAKSGNDGHSGAKTSPLKTIQAAVDKADSNNVNNIGTKIIVNAGVYREDVFISAYRSTWAPVTIQAAVTGTAIIDGSNVLSGWSLQSNGIYTHTWTPNLGTCGVPSGWPGNIPTITRRTEMLFVNGAPMTQVMAQSQLRHGTFFASEGSNIIYLDPPTGVNVSTANIEAAERRVTLNISGRKNIVVRGMVFRHAATCVNNAGVNVNNSSQILFDSDQAVWNNWGGIGIYHSTNVTVQNSVSNYNGGVGFMGSNDQYVLFNFNQSDYNNWRGAQGALYDWGMGGTKLMRMRSTTVQNHYSYRNQAQGLWFDTDNKNITITNATLVGNHMAALQLEANQGPVTVQNSHVCSSGSGVNILNVENLTIKNNTFFNNSGTGVYDPAEIFVAGFANGHKITDWLTGQAYTLITKGTVLTGNRFENGGGNQNVFGTYLAGNDWSQFANSLNASSNNWYDPTKTNSFKIVGGKAVTLGGWQSATGTDYSSHWAKASTSPAGSCGVPTPTYPDFAVNFNRPTYSMSAGNATALLHVSSYNYGTVGLWFTGLPGGVSASLSSKSLTSGMVTIKFHASTTAATQTVPVTLWAVSGNRVHTVTLNLHVTHS
jgi:Right handed beta helix region